MTQRQVTEFGLWCVAGWLACGVSIGHAQDADAESAPEAAEAAMGESGAETEEAAPDAEASEAAEADDLGDGPAAPDAEPGAETDAAPEVDLRVTADMVEGLEAEGSAEVAEDGSGADDGAPAERQHMVGSYLRRAPLQVEGLPVHDGPLRTSLSGRDALMRNRQMTGIAVPSTAAALGLGAPGTIVTLRSQIRQQPTLFLLNGRRMVFAPFPDRLGTDYVDLNQLPIQLVSRVESATGIQSALYGDAAIGGVVNYITQRDYDGIEVQVGGQATDSFDQYEADVAVTFGAGSERTGMNMMVSYFDRQPLRAADRDWFNDRLERHESISGNPLSFLPFLNFNRFPFADPACGIATAAGQATGLELRVPRFGEPVNRAGQNIATTGQLPTEPEGGQNFNDFVLNEYDGVTIGGDRNGMLNGPTLNTANPAAGNVGPYENASYCGNNLGQFQDLVLEESRIQTYATFWHKFSDHVEAFAEIGYFRNDNQNVTPPSFPITRLSADPAGNNPVFIPIDHADIPLEAFGFAEIEQPTGRAPNNYRLVGSPLPLHAGANVNERRIDTFRAVAGLDGDLKGLAPDTVLDTWEWEVSGVYSVSQAYSRVKDTLLDRIGEGLNNCGATKVDTDSSSPTLGEQIPSTIMDRQEAGCFNPFYSATVNNAAVNPLGAALPNAAYSFNEQGFVTSDSDGSLAQDGGYICDPADPNNPNRPCPDSFAGVPNPDLEGPVNYELAGTPNTAQVINGLVSEQITQQRRSLTTVDLNLGGFVLDGEDVELAVGLGGQFRRETLLIDYDAAYNNRRYSFLFGAPDVDPIGRNIAAGFLEARMRLLDGLAEVQAAARVENYENVGTAVSPLVGVAVRPFANSGSDALEYLVVRGHAGLGHQAPSLLQQYGTYTEFQTGEFGGALQFLPYQVQGNTDLDFEKYFTVTGGVQYDFGGFSLSLDGWLTRIDDVIGADNMQTVLRDCEAAFQAQSIDCRQAKFVGLRVLNHVETSFDNLAEVETRGVDGGISYRFDTKRRGVGEFGVFSLGVQGRYIDSYLIKSPRALREYYRAGYANAPSTATPTLDAAGNFNYDGISAEYEAAGFRNLENFAPPLPKLRLAVPLRWSFEGHTLGATMRYIGAYNDDSESTLEKYGLAQQLSAGTAAGSIPFELGETIDAWTVFDVDYGFAFGDADWQTRVAVGVINLLDAAPPAAEGALAYDVGIHDPRGRILYARVTGKF